jgi:hypothetical protein
LKPFKFDVKRRETVNKRILIEVSAISILFVASSVFLSLIHLLLVWEDVLMPVEHPAMLLLKM